MTIEILFFDGCPNLRPVEQRVRELLARAGVDAEIRLRRVAGEQDVHDARFLGSPTVRVDGRDVEAGADERSDYGMKCRLYRTADGFSKTPSDAAIIAAVRSGASSGPA